MQVIALRSLREVLCRALAAVQEGATQLDLGEDAAETARALSAAAHQSVSPSQREHLLAQARDAARLCAKRVQMVRAMQLNVQINPRASLSYLCSAGS